MRISLQFAIAAGILLCILAASVPEIKVTPLTGTVSGSFSQNVSAQLNASHAPPTALQPVNPSNANRPQDLFSDHANLNFRRGVNLATTLSGADLQRQISQLAPPFGGQASLPPSQMVLLALGQAECARLRTALAKVCLVMGATVKPTSKPDLQLLEVSLVFQEQAPIGPLQTASVTNFNAVPHRFQTDSPQDIDAIKQAFYGNAEQVCKTVRATGNCSLLGLKLTMTATGDGRFMATGDVLSGEATPDRP